MASKWAHPNVQWQMIGRFMAVLSGHDKACPSTWYGDWGKLVCAMGAAHGLTPEDSAAIFAAISPRKSIARNWAIFTQVIASGPANGELTRQTRLKLAMMLSRPGYALEYLHRETGPKTWAFAHNLLGEDFYSTVDAIIAQCATGEPLRARVPAALYRAIDVALTHVAWLMGWSKSATQAGIWAA